jgi:tRNA1Val (adenine37-N6)-methyltransferase
MANTYFQFKQFKIEQKACANKVSTDACVFGAWMSKLIQEGSVLDVGAGSGLLALMIGQEHKGTIRGIEIESACAEQAGENIRENGFEHIQIIEGDIRNWESEQKFDWIISNPPFFNNSSKNEDTKRNMARQTETLGPADWSDILNQLGHQDSTVALLLSNNDVLASYESNLKLAGYRFQQKLSLLDKQSSACKRVLLFAKQKAFKIEVPEIFIYKNDFETYSDEFIDLLSPFYIYL